MKILLSAFTFLFVLPTILLSIAGEISRDDARTAVTHWLREAPNRFGCRFGNRAPVGVRSFDVDGGGRFHVVDIEDGGYAVAGGESETEPILAFSDDGRFIADRRNPLYVLLCRDLPQRQLQRTARGRMRAERAWMRLKASSSTALTSSKSLNDIRVAPLVKSKWAQEDDGLGNLCYNFYTPNNVCCGCVATAGAQVMRYFQYPTKSVMPSSHACEVNGRRQTLIMQGGVYDWANMPLIPADGTTLAQRKAIGKLTSDVGISVGMSYDEYGSGAYTEDLANAFLEIFGYANAAYIESSTHSAISTAKLCPAVLGSLDAGLPVVLGISYNYWYDGHEIVGDGYAYDDETLYLHLNMGWAGSSDAWYTPFCIDDGAFNQIDEVIYNIHPTASGFSIASGRVIVNGKAKAGGVVTAYRKGVSLGSANSGSNGVYALLLEPDSQNDCVLVATAGSAVATNIVLLSEENRTGVDFLIESTEVSDDSDAPEEPELRVGDIRDDRVPGFFPPDGRVSVSYDYCFVNDNAESFPVKSYTLTGLPTGLRQDKSVTSATYGHIVGKPTKAGSYTIKAVVTGVDGSRVTVARTVEITPAPALTLKLVANEGGTVKGAASVAYGKKTTVSATAATGRVFAGWYTDPDFTKPFVGGSADYRTAKQTLTNESSADGLLILYARFISAAEDAKLELYLENLLVSEDLTECSLHISGQTNLILSVVSASMPNLTLSGLPSGLKFDTKTFKISGTPKKPGESIVTVKLTNATVKKALVRKFTLSVNNLRDANGCFVSPPENAPGERYVLSIGVDELGLPPLDLVDARQTLKISGLPSGLTYDKANTRLTGRATRVGTYTVYLTVGTLVSTFTIEVLPLPDWAVGTFGGLAGKSSEDGAKGLVSNACGTVSLSVMKTGTISAKVIVAGRTYTFSSKGFATASFGGAYRFVLSNKSGDAFVGMLTVADHDMSLIPSRKVSVQTAGLFRTNDGIELETYLWRNEHGSNGRLAADSSGRAKRALEAVKMLKSASLALWGYDSGTAKLTIRTNGSTTFAGKLADGTSVSATSFLKIVDADGRIFSDAVCYDKKTGKTTVLILGWHPLFDDSGDVVELIPERGL